MGRYATNDRIGNNMPKTPVIKWDLSEYEGTCSKVTNCAGAVTQTSYVINSLNELNAVARDPNTGDTVEGSFAYSPAAGASICADTDITATFTPTDPSAYNSASKVQNLRVRIVNSDSCKTPRINFNLSGYLGLCLEEIDCRGLVTTTFYILNSQQELDQVTVTDPNTGEVVPGTLTFSPPAGTELCETTEVTATFVPDDTATYRTTEKTSSIKIIKIREDVCVTPFIDWECLQHSGECETRLPCEGEVEQVFPHTLAEGDGEEYCMSVIDPTTGQDISDLGAFRFDPPVGTELCEDAILTVTWSPNDLSKYEVVTKKMDFMVQTFVKDCTPTPMMFGCYVEKFESSATWGSQGGSCQLTLVEDPDTTEIDPIDGVRRPVVFNPPQVGTACYFKYGQFYFGGVFQRFTLNESTAGKKYDVILESPGGKVLNGVNVILSNFDGTSFNWDQGAADGNSFGHDYREIPYTQSDIFSPVSVRESEGCIGNPLNPAEGLDGDGNINDDAKVNNPIFAIDSNGFPCKGTENNQQMRNIWNALAHEENYWLAGDERFTEPVGESGHFGKARTNSAGFPAPRLLEILENMSYGKSNFGDPISFGQSRYRLDITAIRDIVETPEYNNFRIAGQTTTISNVIEECCELIQHNYYVTVIPTDDIIELPEGGGPIGYVLDINDEWVLDIDNEADSPTFGQERNPPIILTKLVDRTQQPQLGVVSDYVEANRGESLISYSVGQELSDEVVQKLIIGAPASRWWYCPIEQCVPVWGKDGAGRWIISRDFAGNPVTAPLAYLPGNSVQVMLDESSFNPGYIATVAEIRMALGGKESWQAFKVVESIAAGTFDQDPWCVGFEFTEDILDQFLLYAVGNLAFAATSLHTANNAYDANRSFAAHQVDTIWRGVSKCAENFYRQKFVVPVPEEPGGRDNNLKYLNEDDGVNQGLFDNPLTQVPSWKTVDSAYIELPLVDDIAAYDSNGRLKSGQIYANSNFYDYSALQQDYARWSPANAGATGQDGVFTTKGGPATDTVFWYDLGGGEGLPCIVWDCGVQIRNYAQTALMDRVGDARGGGVIDAFDTTPHLGLLPLVKYHFDADVNLESMIGAGKELLQIQVPPDLKHPIAIGVPQESQKFCWGPWYNFVEGATNGKSEVVFDTSLAPENFGSFQALNEIGASYARAGNAQVIENESGSMRLASKPAFNIADRFTSLGPYITNLSCSIDTSGMYTTYQFNTWTPNFGKLAKYNADRLSRIYKATLDALQRIRQQIIKRGFNPYPAGEFNLDDIDERYRRNRGNGTAIMFSAYDGTAPNDEFPQNFQAYGDTGYAVEGAMIDVSDLYGLALSKYSQSFGATQEQIFSPYQTQTEKPDGSTTHPEIESVAVTDEQGQRFKDQSIYPSSEELDPYFPYELYQDGDNGQEFLRQSDYHSSIHGSSNPDNLQHHLNNNVSDIVRSVGFRGPMVLSGWGYDLAANPVPNDMSATGGGAFDQGAAGNRRHWETGPINLMWDAERKIWSGGHEFIVGLLKSDITAPDAWNEPTTFQVEVARKDDPDPATKGDDNLVVDGEIITGYNRDTNFSLLLKDPPQWIVCVRQNYEWIPLKQNQCRLVIFDIRGSKDVNCDIECPKTGDASSPQTGHIVHKLCGCDHVPYAAEDGTIQVYDDMQFFWEGGGIGGGPRLQNEVAGQGVAMLVENGNECKWVVIYFDHYRDINVITSAAVVGSNLEFGRHTVRIWDCCKLEPTKIPLIDCEDYE